MADVIADFELAVRVRAQKGTRVPIPIERRYQEAKAALQKALIFTDPTFDLSQVVRMQISKRVFKQSEETEGNWLLDEKIDKHINRLTPLELLETISEALKS